MILLHIQMVYTPTTLSHSSPMKKFAALLPVILILAACNGAVSPPTADNPKTPVDYVGMTVQQATEKAATDGVPFRVVMEDGESLAVTMDYRPGRINATVQSGIVVSYDIEGEEADVVYDQDSWLMMIPDSCVSFFDGCNTCRRTENGEVGCTKMFCETYEMPVCTDGQEEGSADAIDDIDLVR